jgi:hypothetical protein
VKPSPASTGALFDDKLSGYPAKPDDSLDQLTARSLAPSPGYMYLDSLNRCWMNKDDSHPNVPARCTNPPLEGELGLCEDHLSQLKGE